MGAMRVAGSVYLGDTYQPAAPAGLAYLSASPGTKKPQTPSGRLLAVSANNIPLTYCLRHYSTNFSL